MHQGRLTKKFEVRTGVRQGCLLSPFLFLIAIDWIMNKTTEGARNGIQWTLWSQLEDLDFADDIALLSHNHEQIQEKTTRLRKNSSQVGLKIHPEKTKLIKVNTLNTAPVSLDGKDLEEVEEFTYHGRIIGRLGGTDAGVKARIEKNKNGLLFT